MFFKTTVKVSINIDTVGEFTGAALNPPPVYPHLFIIKNQ
jgi:hypothetical protein